MPLHHRIDSAAERFRVWEAELKQSGRLVEAIRLSNEIVDPSHANADTCWQTIWPKPLYANTKVELGEAMIERLEPLMRGGWKSWGNDPEQLLITHKGGNSGAGNFEISGLMKDLVRSTRIAPHRLFAIQGGAAFLRHFAAQDGEAAPLKGFAEFPLEMQVLWLQSLAGRGWGHISALHVLTDFGLAVKPDIHLARTVHALEFLPYVVERTSPSPLEALAIVQGVDALGNALFGDDYGGKERRYLDKVLMDVSRFGLL